MSEAKVRFYFCSHSDALDSRPPDHCWDRCL
jgi:hypothetical protein